MSHSICICRFIFVKPSSRAHFKLKADTQNTRNVQEHVCNNHCQGQKIKKEKGWAKQILLEDIKLSCPFVPKSLGMWFHRVAGNNPCNNLTISLMSFCKCEKCWFISTLLYSQPLLNYGRQNETESFQDQ